MLRTKNKNVASKQTTRIGEINYITQPRTDVSVAKGQVVISKTFTYKRRFY